MPIMASDQPKPSAVGQPIDASAMEQVTAIVPARNEQAAIATCIESLARQPENAQILVVNDQSSDATAEIVRNLMKEIPDLHLLEAGGLPDGWVGKNHALWVGVQQATSPWLLFTDADANHFPNSVTRALQIAQDQQAVLVSFSPEQVSRNWYEKALIPFIYRLMGGRPWAAFREIESTFPWIAFLLMVIGLNHPLLLFLGVLLLIARQTIYGLDLARNHYPFSFIYYYVPAVFLYAGVLWASYRSHVKGKIAWKGREYSIGAPESVK